MKKTLLVLFIALLFDNAYAQKLPAKQQASVRIPANVKIDGKATEWNNQFQAYNNATDLYYTLANNSDDLYLIIKTKNRYAYTKIIEKGLTLSIKNPKTGKDVNFTFPNRIGNGSITSKFSLAMVRSSDKVSEREIAGYNKTLADKHKFIKVEGVAGVDSLVSIYNEKGVRAAELLDINKFYTLEMSISIKLMDLLVTNVSKISYHIKINPMSEDLRPVDVNEVRYPDGSGVAPERRDAVFAEMTATNIKMYGGTDFKGEYILAK